jgi:hypothetical protein|tara:strand:- start:13277 stop:13411 length:135 start_codon:yes stop_codon:yes gene_type:complete
MTVAIVCARGEVEKRCSRMPWFEMSDEASDEECFITLTRRDSWD